jgi:hypothetical protein
MPRAVGELCVQEESNRLLEHLFTQATGDIQSVERLSGSVSITPQGIELSPTTIGALNRKQVVGGRSK